MKREREGFQTPVFFFGRTELGIMRIGELVGGMKDKCVVREKGDERERSLSNGAGRMK